MFTVRLLIGSLFNAWCLWGLWDSSEFCAFAVSWISLLLPLSVIVEDTAKTESELNFITEVVYLTALFMTSFDEVMRLSISSILIVSWNFILNLTCIIISDFKCEHSFTCIDSLLIRVADEHVGVKSCELVLFTSLLLLTCLIIKREREERRMRVSADKGLKTTMS